MEHAATTLTPFGSRKFFEGDPRRSEISQQCIAQVCWRFKLILDSEHDPSGCVFRLFHQLRTLIYPCTDIGLD
jgi:hypothetical protein